MLIPAVPPASDELAPAKRWGVRRRDLLLAAGIFVTGRFAKAAPLPALRRLKLGPAPAVASRMARLHALARRQYLNRH